LIKRSRYTGGTAIDNKEEAVLGHYKWIRVSTDLGVRFRKASKVRRDRVLWVIRYLGNAPQRIRLTYLELCGRLLKHLPGHSRLNGKSMWPHDQGNKPAVKHNGKGSLCASVFCVLLPRPIGCWEDRYQCQSGGDMTTGSCTIGFRCRPRQTEATSLLSRWWTNGRLSSVYLWKCPLEPRPKHA
jgi:hypothetical protein